MNKVFAQAWDDIESLAARYDATLAREGHRINYTWTIPAPTSHTDEETRAPMPVTCWIWAEENAPRYGLRFGDIAGRFWNIEAARQVLALLIHTHLDPATPAKEPLDLP